MLRSQPYVYVLYSVVCKSTGRIAIDEGDATVENALWVASLGQSANLGVRNGPSYLKPAAPACILKIPRP